MSFALPFHPTVLQLPLDENLDPEEVSLGDLRGIIKGNERSVARIQAMAMLLASDLPNKHRVLQSVLEAPQEVAIVRYFAAFNLALIGFPAAIEVLIRNLRTEDDQLVLCGVINSLGRIGDEAALAAISGLMPLLTGRAAAEALFAAGLISHRLNLEGVECKSAEPTYLGTPGPCSRPLRIELADPSDAEICLRSIARTTGFFGIEFAEAPMYRISCSRRVYMLLLNHDFVESSRVHLLGQRKAIPAALAMRSPEGPRFSIQTIFLSTPEGQPNRVSILGFRSTGEPSFGGFARVDRSALELSVRAVARPGAFAVEFEGVFAKDMLQVGSARSSFRSEPRLRPTRRVREEGGEAVQ